MIYECDVLPTLRPQKLELSNNYNFKKLILLFFVVCGEPILVNLFTLNKTD